jgi:hypothetical protein
VDHYSLEGWYKEPDNEPITYRSGYEPWPGGDQPLARQQKWEAAGGTQATFGDLAAGHCTMHVRAPGTCEANLTFLVQASTSTKPSKKPR